MALILLIAQPPPMACVNTSQHPEWEAARSQLCPKLRPLSALRKFIPVNGVCYFSSALEPTQKDKVVPLVHKGLIFSVPGPLFLFSFHSLSQYRKAPKSLAVFITEITTQ